MGNRNLFTGRRCRYLRGRAAVAGDGMNAIDHTADWRTKLTQAMEGVSGDDHERLKEDAGSWPTCACGQLDGWIMRDSLGKPTDSLLEVRGVRFCWEVAKGAFTEALTTLDAIEQRAMELKP